MNAAPGYEPEESPLSERLLAALAGHTLGMAPVRATLASLRAPPLRLPADQQPLGTLGDGKRRPPLAGPLLSTRTRRPADGRLNRGLTWPHRTWIGGLSAAAAVGLGMAAGTLAAWPHSAHAGRSAARTGRPAWSSGAQVQQQANLASQQRLHWELLSKAMDDPDLAEVLDIYDSPLPENAANSSSPTPCTPTCSSTTASAT